MYSGFCVVSHSVRNCAGQLLGLYGRIIVRRKKFGGVEGSEFCRLLFWERRRGSEVLYTEYGVPQYMYMVCIGWKVVWQYGIVEIDYYWLLTILDSTEPIDKPMMLWAIYISTLATSISSRTTRQEHRCVQYLHYYIYLANYVYLANGLSITGPQTSTQRRQPNEDSKMKQQIGYQNQSKCSAFKQIINL